MQVVARDVLKNEGFDFIRIDQNPVVQAFAVFSAVKKAVMKAYGQNASYVGIGSATPMVRKFTGFEGPEDPKHMNYGMHILTGAHGCNHSWDSVLGDRWDVIPGDEEISMSQDTAIKTLKFSEKTEFGMIFIKCCITTMHGLYRHEEDYRSLVYYNMTEAAKLDCYVISDD